MKKLYYILFPKLGVNYILLLAMTCGTFAIVHSLDMQNARNEDPLSFGIAFGMFSTLLGVGFYFWFLSCLNKINFKSK